ncbi:MAG: hypothetical protein EZS28_029357 [Streblomastix strix]|uniref:Uncharacterized protein n=1 Tax=Streblomastix strix TaxID=222440 RepID=A0A5J4UZE7_9EUKA|nr:MAG: hypothetical protein EZS28_029357 [Streblomastix strix]
MQFGKKGGLYSEAEAWLTDEKHQEMDRMDEESQKDQSQKNCSNLGRVELFEDLVHGCVFLSECNQQIENKSVKGNGLEREVLLGEEDQERFNVVESKVGGDNVGDLGSRLNTIGCGWSVAQIDELGQLQQVGIDCGAKGNREVLPDIDKQKDVVDQDRQCGCLVCDQEMASQKGDVEDCKKDQGVVGESVNQTLDEAHTWVRRSDGRLIKLVGEN